MKLKRHFDFLSESKVATEESPIGFYTTANALMPDEFFSKLDELDGVSYSHDNYSNLITVTVETIDLGKKVRELALSEIFEADDITADFLPYMTPDEIGDAMEIKLKS